MEAGQRLIVGAASGLVLCIGLYLLILQTRTVSNMFDIVRNQMKDKEIYQQYYEKKIEEVPYAELVATLLNTLDYDIVIDGKVIRRREHDMAGITGYPLKKCKYRKEYQYDADGRIEWIIYAAKE